MNMRMPNVEVRRTPTTVEQAHNDTVGYINELVQNMHQLILRIDSLEKNGVSGVKSVESRVAKLESKDSWVPSVSVKANAKNVKFGLTEEALVDINTLYVSGTDKKIKFKDSDGNTHDLESGGGSGGLVGAFDFGTITSPANYTLNMGSIV